MEGGGDLPPGQVPQRRNYRTRVYRPERPAGQNENEADAAVSGSLCNRFNHCL